MIRITTLAIAAALLSPAFGQATVNNTALTPGQRAEALYRQGLAAQKAGDPVAAQKAFSEALKANPNHAHARYNLGQVKINAPAIAARGREAKFGAVMIPEFRMDDASLTEALEALRIMIERESKEKITPNFVIQDPKNQLGSAKIALNLKNMPSRAVMQYILDMGGAKARHDEFAIVITPRG
ncbi:MAG: tetratricopeptide repeat protein [Akkermansiaceae bacterium]|jgi:tetratricopeptide (TPR) repeat protein|nr:tetratricopeptide repeat protein [Akkermansiaceae bacterium]